MLSLFIFQSLWNVAAAFCVHETLSTHSTTLPHFGHHGAVRCEQNQTTKHTQMQALQEKMKLSSVFATDDHRDHLPSFAHFILSHVQQSANEPLFSAYVPRLEYLYQSPHLSRANPPPVLTPL